MTNDKAFEQLYCAAQFKSYVGLHSVHTTQETER